MPFSGGSSFVLQRIAGLVVQRVQAEVHVERRPVEVIAVQKLDVQDFAHPRISKPRILLVRQEVFRPADKQPDSLAVDLCDLSRGSARAMLR